VNPWLPLVVLLSTSALPLGAQTPGLDADALVARLDRNEAGTSAQVSGTLTVQDRFGTKVSSFDSWALGSEFSLLVFTAGEEKGQKILRRGTTLYVAYPDADKPVKIQGAALKDSVAGSTFSFEDLAGDRTWAGRYRARLVGDEAVAGEACAVVELRARGPGLAYPLVKVWISRADFSGRKLEKYSQNERLLKTQVVEAVLHTGGRTLPSKVVMTDALKAGAQTTFEVTRAVLDQSLPASKFSLEELGW